MDELISRTINTEKPQFDAEKWKQKYPEEYQALLSRAAQGDSISQPKVLKVILKSPLIKIAAAAVIILGVSIFITQKDPGELEQPKIVKATKSPAEMMTAMSLTIAYRNGGMEALETQYDEACKQLGPRPRSLSVDQVLTEFNGT
ncbi:MAG: hypothetical protein ACYS6K_06870 [Planctomycetota bacterium]